MTLVFIDKFGEVWDANSRTFANHFSVTDGLNQRLHRFLVRQAGLSSVAIADNSATVEFVPALTSPSACLGIMNVLEDQHPERVALTWFEKEWTHELSGGWKTAQKRITELAISRRGDPEPKFLSSALDLKSLAGENPLNKLFETWRLNGQTLDLNTNSDELATATGGRFFVVSRDLTTSGVSFDLAGPGRQAFGKNWGKRMVGRDVAHQPDLSYGKWCAECFRNAIEIGRPQITGNDVLVRVPHNPEPKRIRYQRMTLPIQAAGGRPALLSASYVDTAIDLRSEI